MSIQTSDADLKAAQNPITGLTIGEDVSGRDLLFVDCVFTAAQAGIVNVTGTAEFDGTEDYAGDVTWASTFTGTVSTLTVHSTSYNTGAANTVSSSGGITSNVIVGGFQAPEGFGVAASVLNLDQTAPVVAILNVNGYTGNSYATLNANFLSGITVSGGGQIANHGGYIMVSATAATTVDLSGFVGSSESSTFEIDCNATTPVPPVITTTGGSDTYNGPFDQPSVDAIIAAYVAASPTSGSLTIGGTSSSPSSAGAANVAILIAAGMSVTTN